MDTSGGLPRQDREQAPGGDAADFLQAHVDAGKFGQRAADGHSGLVLDTSGDGTRQGTLAVQATAAGSSTQKWTLVSEGSNFYEIKNSASGLLLGISGEGTGDGVDALIWGDNGSRDHLWQIISAASGQYKIENYNSGLVLGVLNETRHPAPRSCGGMTTGPLTTSGRRPRAGRLLPS